MEYQEWKLTDQELAQIEGRGGDVLQAQEAKRKAYLEAGGIILNPDALPDLYEALLELMEALEKCGSEHNDVRVAYNLAKPAIAKAETPA